MQVIFCNAKDKNNISQLQSLPVKTIDKGMVWPGLFIDLFDPELPVLQSKTIHPDEQAYLYDIKKNKSKKPVVFCSASRIYDEIHSKTEYSFVAKSPAETTNVMRIYLPRIPEKVTVKNEGSDFVWDDLSKTCLIKFENDPDGVPVVINY